MAVDKPKKVYAPGILSGEFVSLAVPKFQPYVRYRRSVGGRWPDDWPTLPLTSGRIVGTVVDHYRRFV